MISFVDRVLLHVEAGNGGNGCSSVLREKFKPLGGPDGADGGHGGDVTLVVDHNVTTLLDYHFRPHQKAGSGKPGAGSNRAGADGADLVLPVPDGTVVVDGDGTVLADLVGEGSRYAAARGGRGGLGNASLASPRRRAPGFALLGEPGERRDVVLELKTVADAALVGFPSAGKSSLISVLSAARPKIADYPFTTLAPNLGVVSAGETVFTLADVPGLIPGANQGKGLGLEFLRHVERCSVIAHVVDCATQEPGRDPVTDVDVIEAELSAYGGLEGRPRIIVLNKADVTDAAEIAGMARPVFEERGLPVLVVSAVSRAGLRELTFALAEVVVAARAARPVLEATRIVLRPVPANEPGFVVGRLGTGFVVSGDKPRRWVQQTDFTNDEAVGYLADRLARLGVEAALAAAGAEPGAEVTIGEVTFDWEPMTPAGAGLPEGSEPGIRGTDRRLDTTTRPRADERLELKRGRRPSRHGAEEPDVEGT